MDVESFTAVNGFLNVGTDTELRLVVNGCPAGPDIAGIFTVNIPTSVSQSGWGRIKGTYR
jgi:hypothetical protein